MNNLWAPWRGEYILGPKNGDCVFCAAIQENNPYIITQGETCFAIMNRFPYTAGHCMVLPKRHLADITGLTDAEYAEFCGLTRALVSAIRACMQPHAFNLGINLGEAAGAGVAGHLHQHIVPRWQGDMNFMPVTGHTHVISEHIETTLHKIKEALES